MALKTINGTESESGVVHEPAHETTHGRPLWQLRKFTKHLFVTGGVASSLGKGLTASSSAACSTRGA